MATIGVKSVHLSIFDVLLPNNKCLVADLKDIGGTKLAILNSTQQVLCFNGTKNGYMQIFDIRQRQIFGDPIKLMDDQITAVTVSLDQKTLVTGSKDGMVSLWNLEKGFEERESIEVFYDEETKKHAQVTDLVVHPINLGLFASSSSGVLKLLRVQLS